MPRPVEPLRTAVRALVGRGPQRERLLHAFAFSLRDLDAALLPAPAREEVEPLMHLLAAGQEPLTGRLEGLTDEEIDRHVRAILRAHDAVAGLGPA